ncbi:uncharacterized protein LOC119320821 [Triticum dicoccoides]|uniref:uncharacterized protein LOC119320821 n=1 Tax=Triticum dicoccoides TaxID=85692 RepID=UPI001891E5B8|nr:uncharacterized protein LOC119320821 [Triticum dicoccoides]
MPRRGGEGEICQLWSLMGRRLRLTRPHSSLSFLSLSLVFPLPAAAATRLVRDLHLAAAQIQLADEPNCLRRPHTRRRRAVGLTDDLVVLRLQRVPPHLLRPSPGHLARHHLPPESPLQCFLLFAKEFNVYDHLFRKLLACVMLPYLEACVWLEETLKKLDFMNGVGLPNVGKSTFFNIVTKVGSRAGDSRLTVKKSKPEKDPNKPKLPRVPSSSSCESQSWFLVLFMFLLWNNFRKEYKEKHPDVKQVSVVSALVSFRHPSASLENEKHAGALLLHTSGTVSGAVVLFEATGVMAAMYGGDHKLSDNSIWLLCDGLGLFYGDVDILSDLKLLIYGLVSYYGLIFFVLTLFLVRGKL